MDWNSKAPAEWDWENLANFTTKTSELTKGSDASMYSELGYHHHSSSLGGGGGVRAAEEVSGEGSDRNFLGACNEPMIGLKLGRRTYFEDMSGSGTTTTRVTSLSGSTMSSSSSSAVVTKRSRASYQSTQTPCCQVEGCNLELKSAKDYHRRHRICEAHSKSPRVIVAGLERRFCQQCSRFHDLSEFDDKKRSCRRRLSDHNARRRKPHPEPIQFGSTSLSSSYDGRHQMNFLMNRIPIPVSLPPWHDTTSNYKATQLRDAMSMSARSTASERHPHTSSEELPHSIQPMLHADSDRVLSFQSTSSRVLNHDVTPDLRRALSLLSSNSWGGTEHEPSSSLEPFRDATQTSMEQQPPPPAMHTELPNGGLSSSSQYVQMEQVPSGSRVQSLDSHSNAASSQFQEFQLFRGPYEPACFYPYQIN